MPGAALGDGALQGIPHQFMHRRLAVQEAIDEGAVGAVFQEPTHQVGEQVPVRADGGVHPQAHGFLQFGVEQLTHAVQPLEFKVRGLPGQLQDRAQGVRVVGRELREDRLRRGQQAGGAHFVAKIGVGFAGKDRVVGQPQFLGPFDLGIPVGALDQPHCKPVSGAGRQRHQPIRHQGRALLVRLQDEAEARPVGQIRI